MARIDCTEASRQTLAKDDWEKRERNKELLHLFSVCRPFFLKKKKRKRVNTIPITDPDKKKKQTHSFDSFSPSQSFPVVAPCCAFFFLALVFVSSSPDLT